MDLERALETQRVKLLRLVTRWIFMLGFMSGGPLALPAPRWVRVFFDTVLIRAELAAQYLVQTSISIQRANDLIETPPVRRVRPEQVRDVPSAHALLQRMKALCDLLDNLPRHTRRMMRVRKIVGQAFDFTAPDFMSTSNGLVTAGPQWIGSRLARPPDKPAYWFGWFGLNSLPLSGREAFAVG